MKAGLLILLFDVVIHPYNPPPPYEIGIQHVGVVTTGDTGDLDVPLGRGFAITGERWVSPEFSTALTATFVNPEAILFPSNPPPNDVDLGTIGLQTTSLTARWNFRSEEFFSAFAGAGPALVRIGNLDDQFGDAVEADFDTRLTFVIQGGVRFRPWDIPGPALNLTASYTPLKAEPNVRKTNVPLPGELALNPVTIGIGASWRF